MTLEEKCEYDASQHETSIGKMTAPSHHFIHLGFMDGRNILLQISTQSVTRVSHSHHPHHTVLLDSIGSERFSFTSGEDDTLLSLCLLLPAVASCDQQPGCCAAVTSTVIVTKPLSDEDNFLLPH